MTAPLDNDPLDQFIIDRTSGQTTERKADRRAKFGWAMVALAFAIGMTVALVTTAMAYTNQRDSNVELSDDNDELRQLVISQNAVIGQNTARTNCRTQYANQVTETQSVFLLGIGDALIALGEDDEAEFIAALATLQASREEYADAVDARLAYEDRAAPLPCPITSND
jgi:hypothetical protein